MLLSLVTAKVEVADVVVSKLDGYSGGEEIVLVVKGDFLIGTDLSKGSFQQINLAARQAVLFLPQPSITSPRVDLSRTRLWKIAEFGLWQITPGGNRTDAAIFSQGYSRAQKVVADAGVQPENLDKARTQAEIILQNSFRSLGWSVAIQWKK